MSSVLGVRWLATAVWSVAGGTLHKRIPIETGGSFTVKTARKVLTESICSTGRLFTEGALIHVSADTVALPLETSLAHTLALRKGIVPQCTVFKEIRGHTPSGEIIKFPFSN